jgi:hypothetical protein
MHEERQTVWFLRHLGEFHISCHEPFFMYPFTCFKNPVPPEGPVLLEGTPCNHIYFIPSMQ